MRIVKASEIGTYLYCQRAWWYQRQGATNHNQAAMNAGRQLHERHGRVVMTSGCLRLLAYACLLLALLAAAAYLTQILV
jgi:CRISPR/Cas system-associated exonuclease Cas4 (RecB family)